jgi:hypothetical protein
MTSSRVYLVVGVLVGVVIGASLTFLAGVTWILYSLADWWN